MLAGLLVAVNAWAPLGAAAHPSYDGGRQGLGVVYAFAPSWRRAQNFQRYSWAALTDVCLFGDGILDGATTTDTAAMRQVQAIQQHARLHGVRVSGSAFVSQADLASNGTRAAWVDRIADEACKLQLDAVNADVEIPISARDTATRRALTALMAGLRSALQQCRSGPLQLTFDVAWSPRGVDGRFYDIAAIAKHVDFLFVMAYDMRSQMWAQVCTAEANAPLPLVQQGLQEFQAQGIPARKLVLGVPWYGYRYSCCSRDAAANAATQGGAMASLRSRARHAQAHAANDGGRVSICEIAPAQFRGAPCSDAAGAQVPYGDVMALMRLHRAAVEWDEHASSPYFDLPAPGNDRSWRRIVFDNPRSLKQKYAMAGRMGLLGVGLWNIDALDWRPTRAAAGDRHDMFSAIDAYQRSSVKHASGLSRT